MKLRTPGVQPGQTRMPEFKIYGDNKFYVERTFDMNLRLDQPFAPREDDIQKFEETLQPEMEIIMAPDAFDHSYVEAHNLQVDTHTKTIEDLYPKPRKLLPHVHLLIHIHSQQKTKRHKNALNPTNSWKHQLKTLFKILRTFLKIQHLSKTLI